MGITYSSFFFTLLLSDTCIISPAIYDTCKKKIQQIIYWKKKNYIRSKNGEKGKR